MADDRHGRPTPAEPRARSGTARRTPGGSEPATARSALGLRLILSALFLPVFAAATAGFAVWAAHQRPGDSPGQGPLTALAVICGVLALAAALDLVRVTARRRRERGPDR
ncbi:MULTISPECIES: DUF6343 family protein [Streptomyces]|uniref:Uncharacterized protein n=1 Tax=Streptomyces misionensis TaxID=67331 RepID=A0A1H5GS46_9ACTN|nr:MULTISPECIES: DUF6343 family protein [Streptomyces]SEE18532.1 hypothetical protein SAMN04490357_7206 [Streptomyces misionensis]SFY48639.1 hypothetical protein STEPF1_01865 [Streptomyces sp. F-1]